MKARNILGLVVLLGLMGATGYYLYTHVERYTREVNTGPTVDAAFNPWFAAQAFLGRHGINSHRAMDLPVMLHRLQPHDTLILFNDSPIYDSRHQEILQAWMRNGGHLILAANYEWDPELETSDDAFLDAMGVRLLWLDDDIDDEDSDDDGDEQSDEQGDEATEEFENTADDENADNTAANPDADSEAESDTTAEAAKNTAAADSESTAGDATTTDATAEAPPAATQTCGTYSSLDIFRIAYQDNAPPLQINFGYSYTLEDASQNAIRSANAEPNGLLQYAVGEGRMTVLLETDIWGNRAIGDFDHAFLLWHLVHNSPTVWLVASHDSENLLTLLWRNAAYLIIGCVALLILWGWQRWVRFGPLIPDPQPSRRQLLEHIEASALFSWKHQQLEPLLATLRDDIWLHLNRHHGVPHHAGDNDAAALQKLAELSLLPADLIHHAMTCPPPQREANWIALISQLQTIRNAL